MSFYSKTAMERIPFKTITNKCIVLDLDETLVHTSDKNLAELRSLRIMSDPSLIDLRHRVYELSLDDATSPRKGQGIKTELWGITRPHVKEFLIFCFSYFKVVAVWSAGKKKYVEAIVDFLFRDIHRPHVIYHRGHCDERSVNNHTKPLEKMIKQEPGLSKYMSLENTFIIDDRESVYQDDNPDNGIKIPAYKPTFDVYSLRSDDIALKQLVTWLLRPEVINATDVRKLDKKNVFNTVVTVPFPVGIDYNVINYRISENEDRETKEKDPFESLRPTKKLKHSLEKDDRTSNI